MDIINNLIYFDNNATTAMDYRVAEAMRHYENNDPGDEAAVRLEAKRQLARLIGCKPSEVFFTGGITPSIHKGMEAIFEAFKHTGNHIITNVTEHPEVLKACENLKAKGAEVTYLGVDREGLVNPQELSAAIKPSTMMVSIMAANNQTGVIQPTEKISGICKERQVTFFSDACQFVGKMRCDVTEMGVDCMAFGSHKIHGPKNIGGLFVKDSSAAHQLLMDKEAELSAGITNATFAGYAKTAEVFNDNYWEDSAHISKIKNYFEHQLLDIEGLRINGSTRYRLYNTSNLTFPAAKKVSLLADKFKFTSFETQGSHVLKAMGLSDEEIKNSFRFSFGKFNTLDEVKLLVEEIMKL